MKRIIPIFSTVIFFLFLSVGIFSNRDQENYAFDLGLDLAGGTQLTYEADITKADTNDIPGAVAALQSVLEKRLNALGSSDIRVTTEQASIFSGTADSHYRVLVEIPGVFDATEAKKLIGEIPTLEFRLGPSSISEEAFTWDPSYESTADTGISGKHVVTASISAGSSSLTPTVDLRFNQEGGDLFFELTRDNILHYLVIFLDGEVISAPVIQSAIPGGTTTISGNFTYESAGELASNLKFGALPIPIELIATQSISPSLGHDIIEKGIAAGLYALIAILVLLIFWYRIAGLVAAVTLSLYTLLLLGYFKLTGTDITAPGIAGIVVTIGMAVDANILIFERIKEELSDTSSSVSQSITNGFSRAWTSIRDGNVSSLLVAVVLYFFTTSFVKGFALAFGVGVLLSMFTAVVVTRSLLLAIANDKDYFRKHLVGKIPPKS